MAQLEIEDFAAKLAGELFAITAAESRWAEANHGASAAAGDEMRELAEEVGLLLEERCLTFVVAGEVIVDRRSGEGAADFGGGLEKCRGERAQRGAIGAAAFGEDDDEQAALHGALDEKVHARHIVATLAIHEECAAESRE